MLMSLGRRGQPLCFLHGLYPPCWHITDHCALEWIVAGAVWQVVPHLARRHLCLLLCRDFSRPLCASSALSGVLAGPVPVAQGLPS